MTGEANPLIDDRDVRFLLFEVLDAGALCELPHFGDHSQETFELYLGAVRKLAREVVFASYKPMDEEAAEYRDGRVHTHPVMRELYPQMIELGVLTANRPYEVDGQQLPLTVASLASAYLMAANLSAFGYCMLTAGAAHLIEAFGSDELKQRFMEPMYAGRWTGTMALTEPHAGSSLGDLTTRARPTDDGHYLMEGAKVFISAGDHTMADNIVHLALGRIEGAPTGVKGISLFAVPRLRPEGGELVDNDVVAAGAFHKLGWRGIPSIALNFGERGACHGYLVGEAGRGLSYMFQMMNEARINIGIHAVATASVAYHESLAYARERTQGRAPGMGPTDPPVPIIEHADVRRMLLRQKAIVEGGLCLVARTARYADVAEHGESAEARERAQLLLDLLTPIAKTFPSERGFESNVLAIQIHGGYGYTSEYLPEAWMRDQKLNSIHEGTTGIQSQDLLGRKVLRTGGHSIALLAEELAASTARARGLGLEREAEALDGAMSRLAVVSARIGERAAKDPAAAMAHSVDYLDLVATVVVAWQWLDMAAVSQAALPSATEGDARFYRGKLQAARYWFATELPRVEALAALCESGEDSYLAMAPDWF